MGKKSSVLRHALASRGEKEAGEVAWPARKEGPMRVK